MPKGRAEPLHCPSTILMPCLFSSPGRSNSRLSRSKVRAGPPSPSDGIRHGEPLLQIFRQQEMGKEAGEEVTRSRCRDVAGVETAGSSEQPRAPCSALRVPQMKGIIPASQPGKEKGAEQGGMRFEGMSCWDHWEEQMSAVQAQPPAGFCKEKREKLGRFGFKLQPCPQVCDVLEVIRPWCWGKRGHHQVSSWPRGLQVVLALPGSPQMPPTEAEPL